MGKIKAFYSCDDCGALSCLCNADEPDPCDFDRPEPIIIPITRIGSRLVTEEDGVQYWEPIYHGPEGVEWTLATARCRIFPGCEVCTCHVCTACDALIDEDGWIFSGPDQQRLCIACVDLEA